MRILFLDAYFEPEQIAFTHLEKDLIEGLVHAGHYIEVVCPTPTRGISAEKAREYKKKKSEILYDGHVHVTRFSAPPELKNPLTRALRYFWCNYITYQIGKKAKNIDVVFANSTPPTQGWIAGKVATKNRVPFIYSLQDIFPDSLVNAGMTRKGSLIWKVGRIIEKKTYDNASSIITISRGFKNALKTKGVDETKIEVIPNWIDTSEVYDVPRADNSLIKKYGLNPEKFYVCYSGNIGYSQNLDLLVEVAKELQIKTNDIEFVVIGDGAAREELACRIQHNNLGNIKLLPFQPYEDIASVFSLGDVGLIISKPGIGCNSVPSKTWSIMAAERPVLASFDSNSYLYKLINEVNCGIAVEAGKKELLIQAVLEMYNNRAELREFAVRGVDYVKKELNKEKCVASYISTLCEGKKNGLLSMDRQLC